MLLKPFLPILGIAALFSALTCRAGFAATRTTSFSVTATVAAGCRISPASTPDTRPESGKSNHWNPPISMNCSLPVPYQIIVLSRPMADHPQFDLVTPGYSHDYDLNLSRTQDRLNNSGVASSNEPVGFVSRSVTQGHAEAMRCTADDDGSEIMTVTIIY
jgi:hypothetical protein